MAVILTAMKIHGSIRRDGLRCVWISLSVTLAVSQPAPRSQLHTALGGRVSSGMCES